MARLQVGCMSINISSRWFGIAPTPSDQQPLSLSRSLSLRFIYPHNAILWYCSTRTINVTNKSSPLLLDTYRIFFSFAIKSHFSQVYQTFLEFHLFLILNKSQIFFLTIFKKSLNLKSFILI